MVYCDITLSYKFVGHSFPGIVSPIINSYCHDIFLADMGQCSAQSPHKVSAEVNNSFSCIGKQFILNTDIVCVLLLVEMKRFLILK